MEGGISGYWWLGFWPWVEGFQVADGVGCCVGSFTCVWRRLWSLMTVMNGLLSTGFCYAMGSSLGFAGRLKLCESLLWVQWFTGVRPWCILMIRSHWVGSRRSRERGFCGFCLWLATVYGCGCFVVFSFLFFFDDVWSYGGGGVLRWGFPVWIAM